MTQSCQFNSSKSVSETPQQYRKEEKKKLIHTYTHIDTRTHQMCLMSKDSSMTHEYTIQIHFFVTFYSKRFNIFNCTFWHSIANGPELINGIGISHWKHIWTRFNEFDETEFIVKVSILPEWGIYFQTELFSNDIHVRESLVHVLSVTW